MTTPAPDDSLQPEVPPVAPKVGPEPLSLRAKPRRVVRLNRRTLGVLLAGAASLVMTALIWSLQPQRSRDGDVGNELYNTDKVPRSEGLENLPADYSKLKPESAVEPPQLGPPLPGDLGAPILNAQRQAQGYDYSNAGAGPDPAEAERLARLKEAEEAALSSVFFRTTERRTPPGTPADDGQVSAYPATNAFDPMGPGPESSSPQLSDPAVAQNGQAQKEAFLKAGTTETRNSGDLKLPQSPYQVMAGNIIAAALVTGIKSDLPGDVIATVTEPVYDTATGTFLLIPQGSRLLGKYNSQVSFGQSRVQVVWNRIILPDTSSITLDNQVGSDPAGYAGLEDEVDWHWKRIFAGAVLTTVLGIGAELAAPDKRQDGNRIIIAGQDSLQDTVNQIGQEVTRRNLNIQPTLTERPGLPVRIIVNRDLVLRPYQPMFFQRGMPR
ncbi:TrbI/VirB10 family protein [Pseudomonas aeruginosa]|uniref:TrbI/VirB10 family protein n=1 Tax=Pseudomonas aeruginosa TaxID=287 RepID=UPI00383B7B79